MATLLAIPLVSPEAAPGAPSGLPADSAASSQLELAGAETAFGAMVATLVAEGPDPRPPRDGAAVSASALAASDSVEAQDSSSDAPRTVATVHQAVVDMAAGLSLLLSGPDSAGLASSMMRRWRGPQSSEALVQGDPAPLDSDEPRTPPEVGVAVMPVVLPPQVGGEPRPLPPDGLSNAVWPFGEGEGSVAQLDEGGSAQGPTAGVGRMMASGGISARPWSPQAPWSTAGPEAAFAREGAQDTKGPEVWDLRTQQEAARTPAAAASNHPAETAWGSPADPAPVADDRAPTILAPVAADRAPAIPAPVADDRAPTILVPVAADQVPAILASVVDDRAPTVRATPSVEPDALPIPADREWVDAGDAFDATPPTESASESPTGQVSFAASSNDAGEHQTGGQEPRGEWKAKARALQLALMRSGGDGEAVSGAGGGPVEASTPRPGLMVSGAILSTDPSRGPSPSSGSGAAFDATESIGVQALAPLGRSVSFAIEANADLFSESSGPPTLGPFDGEPHEQVLKAIRLQWQNGVGEARLTLHPENLGEVGVQLRVERGGVTAILQAETTEAADWIRSHREDLRVSLSSHGLELESMDVVVDPESRRRQPQRDQPPVPQRNRRRTTDTPTFDVHV